MLILALYRAGRQADAPAVYRGLRRRLVDELAVEPSAALQVLERAILRGDPVLQTLPPATASGTADPPDTSSRLRVGGRSRIC